MEVSDRHVVFPCGNCGTLVAHESCGRRSAVRACHVDSKDDDHARWYPFWAFDDDQILVPAFAIRNYRLLVRFGAIISGQKREYTDRKPECRALEGVTLHQDIAHGLAQLIRMRRQGPINHASDIITMANSVENVSADYPRLIYAPLRSEGSELIDPQTGLCLTRSALTPS